MARVRNIAADELPADLAQIYREFAASYGPFANQVAYSRMSRRRCAI